MRRADIAAAALLGALGAFLVISGATFPAGIGGLPGAGFFPQAIGALMGLLAIGLVVDSRRRPPEERAAGTDWRGVAMTAVLLMGYLLLWGSGWFIVRTAAFLAAMLVCFGQRWIPALGYASALAVFVYLAFDAGLNVSLE